ncbi:MAG: PqqD family protein [Candidatus Omnitrophota bacterium]
MFRKSDNVVTREIEGEVILMPLYSSSKDLNCLYTLNETAAYAWSLMDGKTALSDIKDRLMDRYEVNEAKLDKELGALIKDLRSIKAIS